MKQKLAFKIRESTKADIPVIIDLAKQLVICERSPDSFVATAEDYERLGWGPEAIYKVC